MYRKFGQKNTTEDDNKSRFWTKEQENELKNSLIKGNTFKDLIKEFPNRTENALKWRAMKIVREEIKSSGKNTEAVLDKYGIDVNEYKEYLEKMAEAEKKKKNTVETLAKKVEELEGRVKKLENKKSNH